METRKRLELWQAILSVILETLFATAMGISPLEAARVLKAPNTAERHSVGEAQHGD